MKERHVRHHFVPKSYLKNWQDSDGKICVYRTLVEHQKVPIWTKKSVAAVAYWGNLYTRFVSGQESDEMELWFDREFEAPAETVIQKVISNQRLTSGDWKILIRFLAAQDVRTPARLFEHMKSLHELLSEVLNEVMADLKEKIQEKGFVESMKSSPINNSNMFPLKLTKELKAGAEYGTIQAKSYVGRATWLFSIKYQLERTVKVLERHKWTIVAPADGYNWFTSDTPVIRINYFENGKYDLRGGWGNINGNIFFPLGPKHAMFVQVGHRSFSKGTKLNAAFTKEFLKFTAENSHRMIFSHFVDQNIPNLKSRLVDSEQIKREKEAIQSWHDENVRLEKEFEKKDKL